MESPGLASRQRPTYPASAVVVTADQLAVWLQVSKRTLWRLRAEGLLPPPLRLGKSIRWRASVIEEWLAGGCPVGQERPGD